METMEPHWIGIGFAAFAVAILAFDLVVFPGRSCARAGVMDKFY